MRITAFFLLISIMTVSAATFAQKITLNEKRAPLEKVLNEIRQQSGHDIVYSDDLISQSKPVTVNLKDATLEDALRVSLDGQPLTYEIEDGTVVIKQKGTSVIDKVKAYFATIVVTGHVVDDEQGRPIAGATVAVKGTGNVTITDERGDFELKNVEDKAVIVISFVGYNKKEVTASSNLGIIRLSIASSPLDEVKVIAYGQTTGRLDVGDISTVSAKTIETQPVANPLLTLAGRVPGLLITQSTGMPGSAVTPQIQGSNSIGNGNDPFYVVDGVPYPSELLRNLGQVLGTTGNNYGISGSSMSFIDPNEIESISILKGADATSIYGSRAANGAILITTKKGKAGETRVDLNLRQGFGQVAHQMDLLNTPQFLQVRNEGNKNNGVTTQPSDYDINGTWDTTRYTNWQKQLIGGTAQYANYNASVSGGTISTQYLVGGTFHRETSVFPDNFSDRQGGVHFNINTSSTNQKFKFQLSGNYLIDDNKLPSIDLTYYAVTLSPDAPNLYTPNGSLNWMPDANGSSTWTNPLGILLRTYEKQTHNLIGSSLLSYQLTKNLNIQSSFGYNNLSSDENLLVPSASQRPENRPVTPSFGQFGNADQSSWIVEPKLRYNTVFGKGKLEVLLGGTIEQDNSSGLQLIARGFNDDEQLSDIGSASSVSVQSSIRATYKYSALYSRINYSLQDKYLLDLTARRDGSSRFGSANQFHNFGSAGVAWIFSQEKFVSDHIPFLSFGKLRSSYGTTGNDQIGDYQFLSLYYPAFASIPYQGLTGLIPGTPINPYLQWEATRKFEAGLDLGFFKDRILLTLDYYHNRSSNELLPYHLPATTGSASILTNFPATVQNTGVELALNTINIKNSSFSWRSGFNLTVPRNKLVAFPNLSTSTYGNFLTVGQPITITKVFHFLDVNPTTGLYEFAGINGPTSNPDPLTDQNIAVNTAPSLFGGFENSFQYKGLTLDFLFQFVRQKGLNDFFGNFPGNSNGYAGNQPVSVLDRWRKPGDRAPIQQYDANYMNYTSQADATISDAAYTSTSFIRLKNLSLSWTLPHGFTDKIKMRTCSVYMEGQNLLTFTPYKGLDPESASIYTLPPLRVFSFGIKAGF
ncbi:MAG TPA: SusC/RagA family TonB-linked outer membrane protein [Mucilaginibacter sp.]